jgi:hypothetical protein
MPAAAMPAGGAPRDLLLPHILHNLKHTVMPCMQTCTAAAAATAGGAAGDLLRPQSLPSLCRLNHTVMP